MTTRLPTVGVNDRGAWPERGPTFDPGQTPAPRRS